MDYNKIYGSKEFNYRFKSTDMPSLLDYFKKKAGWIYIATSKDNNFLKIGRTGKDPMHRAKTLSTTGVFNEYNIVFSLKVFNQFILEKNIHTSLKKYRVTQSKEFFNTSLSLAINAIEQEVIKEETLLSGYFDLDMIKEDLNLLPYALKD